MFLAARRIFVAARETFVATRQIFVDFIHTSRNGSSMVTFVIISSSPLNPELTRFMVSCGCKQLSLFVLMFLYVATSTFAQNQEMIRNLVLKRVLQSFTWEGGEDFELLWACANLCLMHI